QQISSCNKVIASLNVELIQLRAMTNSMTQLDDPLGHDVLQQPAEASALTREILTLAAVVVLGAIMTVLDAIIVNVALPTLGREFGTSIATIQWVTTACLVAFASVIPLTGWASQRLGAKELWLLSLALSAGAAPRLAEARR